MRKARVVLFGDPQGIPQLLDALGDRANVVAIVQSGIRPAQAGDLARIAAGVCAPLVVQARVQDSAYRTFVEHLRSLSPDLFLINSYSMILRPELLVIPKEGAVNIHGAILPNYRGANVTEWALINEERWSGVTMHLVDAGIDTGPIVAQAKVRVEFCDTWVDARQRTNIATRELLRANLANVIEGRYASVSQGEGRHWRRRTAADGRFEWTLPLRQIYNLVRALVAPHPGAFWDNLDGSTGVLDRWMSLAELAVFKADRLGAWSYRGVSLQPLPPALGLCRAAANACIAFEISGAAGSAIATLRDLNCYENSARAELGGAHLANELVASALEAFVADELGISRLSRVETAS